jgi:hypothetical protein
MPSISLTIGFNLRDTSNPIHNFSVLSNVSSGYYETVNGGIVTRSDKKSINEPEWTHQHNTGLSTYFKRHNGFRDHERYNRVARNFVLRQGTFVKYYTTTFNPEDDPLYHEDNNREVDRVFDIPIILSFAPENELYSRFGIQHLDEFETHAHMMLFLELNWASLQRCAIEPACPKSEHNPIWSQRGYEAFRYHGYTFEQIGPKAGDKVKFESFDSLYEIESVKDAAPEYQHRGRKYWWKLFMKDAHDTGQTISDEVLNDPEQRQFINDLIGQSVDDGSGNVSSYPFDVSGVVDELKKDVLFRPPEVSNEVEDISGDDKFYPNGDKFGRW